MICFGSDMLWTWYALLRIRWVPIRVVFNTFCWRYTSLLICSGTNTLYISHVCYRCDLFLIRFATNTLCSWYVVILISFISDNFWCIYVFSLILFGNNIFKHFFLICSGTDRLYPCIHVRFNYVKFQQLPSNKAYTEEILCISSKIIVYDNCLPIELIK